MAKKKEKRSKFPRMATQVIKSISKKIRLIVTRGGVDAEEQKLA